MLKKVLFAETHSKITVIAKAPNNQSDIVHCDSVDKAKHFILVNEQEYSSFELLISKTYSVKVTEE